MKRLYFPLVGGLALFGLPACQVGPRDHPSALQCHPDRPLTISITLESACPQTKPLVITFESPGADGCFL